MLETDFKGYKGIQGRKVWKDFAYRM